MLERFAKSFARRRAETSVPCRAIVAGRPAELLFPLKVVDGGLKL
jgi:hypothetical protein